MPALNFKAQFAPSVESGQKRCTIRVRRKYPIKVGDRLYLYTGMRTKQCRKLSETICKTAQDIRIKSPTIVWLNRWGAWGLLPDEEIHALAHADGFETVTEFVSFFRETYGLPFEGQLIKW